MLKRNYIYNEMIYISFYTQRKPELEPLQQPKPKPKPSGPSPSPKPSRGPLNKPAIASPGVSDPSILRWNMGNSLSAAFAGGTGQAEVQQKY